MDLYLIIAMVQYNINHSIGDCQQYEEKLLVRKILKFMRVDIELSFIRR